MWRSNHGRIMGVGAAHAKGYGRNTWEGAMCMGITDKKSIFTEEDRVMLEEVTKNFQNSIFTEEDKERCNALARKLKAQPMTEEDKALFQEMTKGIRALLLTDEEREQLKKMARELRELAFKELGFTEEERAQFEEDLKKRKAYERYGNMGNR